MSEDTPSGRRWSDMLRPKQPPPSVPPPAVPRAFLPESAPLEAPASPAPAAAPVAPADDEDGTGYRAFVTDRGQRGGANFIEIRYFSPQTGIAEGYLLPLHHFVQAYFIGENRVVLRFTESVFTIEGRGARRVVELIHQRNLHIIQEWSAAHWPEPPADQPKVTKVSMMTMEEMLNQVQLQRGR